jgi:sugar lactone lactonase YvrE
MRLRLPGLILATVCAALTGVTVWYLSPNENPAPLKRIFAKKPVPSTMTWEAEISTYAQRFAIETGKDKSAKDAQAVAPIASEWSDAFGIVFDRKGNTYIADAGDHNRILRINKEGKVEVFAGGEEGFVDSPADGKGDGQNETKARFNTPSALAIDSHGNLFVADTANHAIRKITPDGKVSTVAGTGVAGYRDGVASQAQFNGPIGVALNKQDEIIVADTYNDKIRLIKKDGQVVTIAGGDGPGYQDGLGSAALFDTPSNVVVNRKNEIIVADTRNNAIRKITPAGEVSTLMFSAKEDQNALMRRPLGLAITHDDHIYVGELSHGRLLQIAPNGESRGLTGVDIDIIAGDDTSPRIQSPAAIAVTAGGELLVSDAARNRVHRVKAKTELQAKNKSTLVAPNALAEEVKATPGNMPWPLLPQDRPHEVVGTIGEVRGNYSGESRDHFHRGLDVQGDMGESVVAVRNEKVSSPAPTWAAGTINEGMRISKFSYIHMKVGRTQKDAVLNPQKFQLMRDSSGKLQQVRVQRGTRFAVGETVGTINSMYHVHLNYAPEGEVVNPLSLKFAGFQDNVAPQINHIDIADRDGRILGHAPAKARPQAKRSKLNNLPSKNNTHDLEEPLLLPRSLEEVSIIVDAFDQADGNAERRRLGLYELGYQIFNSNGAPLPGFETPQITVRFNLLPSDEEAVKVAYAENSGITVHGSATTRFLYNISNEIKNGHAVIKYWKIKDLPAGEYRIRVYAADYAGNRAVGQNEIVVRVE